MLDFALTFLGLVFLLLAVAFAFGSLLYLLFVAQFFVGLFRLKPEPDREPIPYDPDWNWVCPGCEKKDFVWEEVVVVSRSQPQVETNDDQHLPRKLLCRTCAIQPEARKW